MSRNASFHALLALSLLGCSASTSADTASLPPQHGSVGVGQGGAQDIGEFRSILSSGAVPSPDTLDPVGFFAEHALTLPAADCGDTICAQGSLAVARRFDGSPWQMAFVALNSSVDASTLVRPPVHTVIVVEHTRRLETELGSIFDALHRFTVPLRAEDRVTIIEVEASATVLASAVGPTDPSLAAAATTLAGPTTATTAATYDGLALAADALSDASWTGHRHVLLVTSGHADAGLTSRDQVLALAQGLLESGATLSLVGTGDDYADALPIAIGELGGGGYYFAQDGADLSDVLDLEGRTALFPIARDFTMRVTAAPGYTIGRTYGAARATSTPSVATLSSTLLLLGQRTGPSDVEGGRRGGGGGFFVELEPDAANVKPAGAPAFTVEISYTDTSTGNPVTRTTSYVNPLASDQTPGGNLPELGDTTQAEAFMMLNMYLTLKTSTELYSDGDCARAMGTIDMMQQTIEWWQGSAFASPDIQADWQLVNALRDTLDTQCSAMGAVTPIPPASSFHGSCFID
ncbi:MAG: hypothetical protein U0234_01370 [Sandaracinus sp.]